MSAGSYSAGLFVAIVWAAAFFMLNSRDAARRCGAAPGHRDGHPRRAAQPQRAGDAAWRQIAPVIACGLTGPEPGQRRGQDEAGPCPGL